MSINTDRILRDANIVDVISRHLILTKKGTEYYGICPFHDDKHSSLQVNENKKVYKCFACGAGGDAIDFLMRKGITFHQAVEEIEKGATEGRHEAIERAAEVKAAPKSEWKQIKPPSGVTAQISHYRYGIPHAQWTYRDKDGNPIGYVCRFNMADGSKLVLPYTYATNGTVSEWRWLGFGVPRPLYNLHLIYQHPTATIILVEGEKTADAVQAQINPNEYVATTWVGGSNGYDKSDFKPILTRSVVLWPDNDDPGRIAMKEIERKLQGKRIILSVPENMPPKWDAADKQWRTGELVEFVRKNTAPPDNPPLPPIDPQESLPTFDNPHYRMLGYDKDENSRLVYFFFSFDAKTVVKLSPSSMNKANLMMLAPLNYWEDEFPSSGKAKIDIDAATQYLIANSHRVGTFKDKFIRGRGAWIDNGKIIIHAGDLLIVDKQAVPLKTFKSRYVYEIGERLGFGTSQMLSSKQSRFLIDSAKWLTWEREINAYLLAGWCVIAPFCGVLQWRPHIWVTGPAGSGKSWVMDNFIKRILGGTAVVVQGKTTEAGIRGLLQNDARAVLFDESDVDSQNDKERIQSIISTARSSSYHDGGVVGKGTQSGASRTYTMRSCFAFSSIGVHINQQSDRTRFTMLGLLAFEGKRRKEEFIDFEREWHATVTDDYVEALQSRTLDLLPIILKNAKTFASAVDTVIGQRRIGDQVGAMLAGAYSLTSIREITFDDAVKWVQDRDWTEERALELTKDEYQLLSKIISKVVFVESTEGRKERSVGEMILIVISARSDWTVTEVDARERLRRMGIIIRDSSILIANNSDEIMSIIRDTAWSKSYSRVLERIPGAQKVKPLAYCPGIKQRGVSIPLSIITDSLEDFEDDPRSNNYNKAPDEMPF
jgi:putative DNA primase/helicase